MKRKGFTLVELIAVIVVLGLISLIAIPTVTSSLKKYKENLYNDSIKSIEQAARNWGAENIGKLPNVTSGLVMYYPDIDYEAEYSTVKIRVSDLQAEGYLDAKIKNPKDSSYFCNCAYVTISKTGTGHTYDIQDNSEGLKLLTIDENGCTC